MHHRRTAFGHGVTAHALAYGKAGGTSTAAAGQALGEADGRFREDGRAVDVAATTRASRTGTGKSFGRNWPVKRFGRS